MIGELAISISRQSIRPISGEGDESCRYQSCYSPIQPLMPSLILLQTNE